jgi:hypothetical protein
MVYRKMDKATPRSYPAAKTSFQAPTLRVCAWSPHCPLAFGTQIHIPTLDYPARTIVLTLAVGDYKLVTVLYAARYPDFKS